MSEEKKGFFGRLVSGLFNGFSNIDDDFYEELEENLIMGDIGVHTTEAILDNLKAKVKENHIKEPAACKQLLIDEIKAQMRVEESAYDFENETSVVLVIGVNGVGKTTTIGKLAMQLKSSGKKVIMAAADTFRAAAGEQLEQWELLLPDLHIGFSISRSGGLVFPSLSEFSAVSTQSKALA